MEPWIVIIIAVAALVVGVLIGRIPLKGLYKILSETLKNAKTFKNRADNLQRHLTNAQRDAQNAEMRKTKAESESAAARRSAEILHSSCTNGDLWSDHTAEHPNGLTPAVRRAIKKRDEEARIAREAQERATAERRAKEKAEREEREAEAAKRRRSSSSNSYGGYNDGGASTIAMAAAVSTTVDSTPSYCDTSSASVDCSSF